MKRAQSSALGLFAMAVWSSSAYAQSDSAAVKQDPAAEERPKTETESSAAVENGKETAANEGTITGDTSRPVQDVEARQRQLEEEVAALKAEMDRRDKSRNEEIAALKGQYDQRLDEMEMSALENASVSNTEKLLEIYGFYDFTASWKQIHAGAFIDESVTNTNLQFLIQNVNLYLSSQMTETLSFLTELHFTFLPNGAETSLDVPTWSRTDTTATDPYTQNEIRLGGVQIERVELDYEPLEFLGVKVGYFITPYGIWHVDHGSPVRLSILPPFENNTVTPAATKGIFPLPDAQLGFMIFGNISKVKNLHFNYALTISNGRGPADTVIDYDNNKAVGLRLRLSYNRPDVEVSAGCYGYFGEYTDQQREKDAQTLGLGNIYIAENFKEYVISTDLLIAVHGVRFQAEHITNLVRYGEDSGRPIDTTMPFFNGFVPDYVGNYVYGLLGYKLPLDKWLKVMTLTPYFGAEFDMPRDYMEDTKNLVFWFGLNFSPSPFITLKIEGSRNHMEFSMGGDLPEGILPPSGFETTGSSTDVMTADVWTVAGQLAVSF